LGWFGLGKSPVFFWFKRYKTERIGIWSSFFFPPSSTGLKMKTGEGIRLERNVDLKIKSAGLWVRKAWAVLNLKEKR
jgi:hypothetical protein